MQYCQKQLFGHKCTNITHSLVPLQDLILTLVHLLHNILFIILPTKLGIKCFRGTREYVSFVYVHRHITIFDQMHALVGG